MTISALRLDPAVRPKYRAIARAVADAIASGRLAPDERLPTHRALADAFGVTVGTVTRAYQELAAQRLTSGAVGRGTFVARPAIGGASDGLSTLVRHGAHRGLVNLAINAPSLGPHVAAFSETLVALSTHEDLADLLIYQDTSGRASDRAAAAEWLRGFGLDAGPERVVLTAGCQHANLVALMATTRPGDLVLTERATWPGIVVAAERLGLRLRGLEMDAEGLLPDALDEACRASRARVLYCIPSLQNPTAAVMSRARRAAIAEVVARHELTLIEDDVLGFLTDDATPLASLIPERTIYTTSLSKALAPSLRVGYLLPPPHLVDDCRNAVHATTVMVPTPLAEIASRWLNDGTAARLIAWQRAEQEARQAIAARVLDGLAYQTAPRSFHIWLALPPDRPSLTFVADAQLRGVSVSEDNAFYLDGGAAAPHVRVSLSGAADRSALERGLTALAALMRSSPAARAGVI